MPMHPPGEWIGPFPGEIEETGSPGEHATHDNRRKSQQNHQGGHDGEVGPRPDDGLCSGADSTTKGSRSSAGLVTGGAPGSGRSPDTAMVGSVSSWSSGAVGGGGGGAAAGRRDRETLDEAAGRPFGCEKGLERANQFGAARNPEVPVLGHHALNQCTERGIDIRFEIGEIGWLDVDDLPQQGERAVTGERRLAAESLEERHPERE